MKPPRTSRPSGRLSRKRPPSHDPPVKDAVKGRGKLGASLQDAALERMTGTIAELERCREPTLAGATHEIRRNGKKLRALLRLVRECLGRRAFQVEDRGLRAMGREFGKLRDAGVMVHTLDALRKRYFERGRPALLTHARRLLLAEVGRRARRLTQGETIAVTTAALQAARTRCLAWDVRGFGWREALRAVRQSYKRTRAAASRAFADPTVRRLHEWRRRTKMLGEQLRLLRRLHPLTLDELAHEFNVLAEFLGDDHDLTLLRDELVAQRARLSPARELDALLEVLELRRGELIRTALDLGERLFEPTAREFARALEECHRQHRLARKTARKLASMIGPGL